MKYSNKAAVLYAVTTDYFCITYIYLLISLTFLFSHRITEWQSNALDLLIAGSIFTIFSWITRRIGQEYFSFSLRVISVMILLSFLFQAIGPLQQIVHNVWFDEMVIGVEKEIIGTETSLLLEKVTTPFLTEWMMFSYVIYVPLLPLVAFLCYRFSGRSAGENYLLNLITVNALCFTGFILFPLKTQLFHMPEAYTIPLEGGIFTWIGEWIRETQHYPGGALPSPHTAASTVMLIFIYRYARKYFYLVLPVVFTIYIATVYGRYHYIWDSMLGIITAILTVRATPYMAQFLAKYQMFPTQIGRQTITGQKI